MRALPSGRGPAKRRLHRGRRRAEPQRRLAGLDGSERVIPRLDSSPSGTPRKAEASPFYPARTTSLGALVKRGAPARPTPACPRRRVARGGWHPARVPPSQVTLGLGTRRCNPEASGTQGYPPSGRALGVLWVQPASARRRGGRCRETSPFRLSGLGLRLDAQHPLRTRGRIGLRTPSPTSDEAATVKALAHHLPRPRSKVVL